MKYCRIIPAILALLTSGFSSSQNLIINPSFEDYVQCPDGLGQADFSVNWQSSLGSCDYFNECSPWVGVPTNYGGSQYAFEGLGYCGLFTYDDNNSDNREVLSAQLLAPLEVGITYYFSMRYCRAGEGVSTSLASNNLGIKLSEESNSPAIDNTALLYSSEVVVDTTMWHILSGSFVPMQEYTHIHIGNFFDDSNTMTVIDGNGDPRLGYFYVDDVRLSVDSTDMHVHVNLSPSAYSPKAIVVDGDRSIFLSFLAQASHVFLYAYSGSLSDHFASPIDGYVNFSSQAPGLYLMKYFKMDGSFETVLILIE